ncbi:MAG: FAD synthase [Crenarchaeota archaeon]|nr:FAD synthase [Thermoproteota archaeon]MCR8453521.1 FAD synthase [Thermoproteota archaeon]MCR8454836.1 FAD synthase [Thermoproteota archaeon]MCR8462727.1 FAD synthase [Thermoproteota archaeon]MCR8470347.1 FAD synthase [Thermoproteota archaeon]
MKKKTKTKILVAGTFDIIHSGHIKFLYAAKSLANDSELIVVVARDRNVKRIKGHEPIFGETERLEIVSALKPVDKAILGLDSDNIFEILKVIKPDIVALGYDQKISESELITWAERQGLKLKIVRLPKFSAGISSSSEVRRKLMEKD